MIEPEFLRNDPLYTLKEAAELIRVSESTVRCELSHGKLEATKIRSKTFIRLSALREYLERCRNSTNLQNDQEAHSGTLHGRKIDVHAAIQRARTIASKLS